MKKPRVRNSGPFFLAPAVSGLRLDCEVDCVPVALRDSARRLRRVPPTQFWLRRTSPDRFDAPRTPFISRRWTPWTRRIESGSPLGRASSRRAHASASRCCRPPPRRPRLGTLRCGFEREEVVEGCLGPLELRRDHRLLANEGVDDPVERGDHLARQIEARERILGAGKNVLQSVERERRFRGGSGSGTKAATASPATVLVRLWPTFLATRSPLRVESYTPSQGR